MLYISAKFHPGLANLLIILNGFTSTLLDATAHSSGKNDVYLRQMQQFSLFLIDLLIGKACLSEAFEGPKKEWFMTIGKAQALPAKEIAQQARKEPGQLIQTIFYDFSRDISTICNILGQSMRDLFAVMRHPLVVSWKLHDEEPKILTLGNLDELATALQALDSGCTKILTRLYPDTFQKIQPDLVQFGGDDFNKKSALRQMWTPIWTYFQIHGYFETSLWMKAMQSGDIVCGSYEEAVKILNSIERKIADNIVKVLCFLLKQVSDMFQTVDNRAQFHTMHTLIDNVLPSFQKVAQAVFNGKIYKSNPITVDVTGDGPQSPLHTSMVNTWFAILERALSILSVGSEVPEREDIKVCACVHLGAGKHTTGMSFESARIFTQATSKLLILFKQYCILYGNMQNNINTATYDACAACTQTFEPLFEALLAANQKNTEELKAVSIAVANSCSSHILNFVNSTPPVKSTGPSSLSTVAALSHALPPLESQREVVPESTISTDGWADQMEAVMDELDGEGDSGIERAAACAAPRPEPAAETEPSSKLSACEREGPLDAFRFSVPESGVNFSINGKRMDEAPVFGAVSLRKRHASSLPTEFLPKDAKTFCTQQKLVQRLTELPNGGFPLIRAMNKLTIPTYCGDSHVASQDVSKIQENIRDMGQLSFDDFIQNCAPIFFEFQVFAAILLTHMGAVTPDVSSQFVGKYLPGTPIEQISATIKTDEFLRTFVKRLATFMDNFPSAFVSKTPEENGVDASVAICGYLLQQVISALKWDVKTDFKCKLDAVTKLLIAFVYARAAHLSDKPTKDTAAFTCEFVSESVKDLTQTVSQMCKL